MTKSTITRAFAVDPRDQAPDATEFHLNATLLMGDVEVLQQRMFSSGVHILLMHAIELTLKSYLIWNGLSKADVERQFGHKLSKLLSEAKRKGLVLSNPGADELVRELDKYTTRAAIRYDFHFTMPTLPNSIGIDQSILADTKPPLPNASPA